MPLPNLINDKDKGYPGWEAVVIAQVAEFLPPTWETWLSFSFLAPTDLDGGRRGHGPRNAGGVLRLEKARKQDCCLGMPGDTDSRAIEK